MWPKVYDCSFCPPCTTVNDHMMMTSTCTHCMQGQGHREIIHKFKFWLSDFEIYNPNNFCLCQQLYSQSTHSSSCCTSFSAIDIRSRGTPRVRSTFATPTRTTWVGSRKHQDPSHFTRRRVRVRVGSLSMAQVPVRGGAKPWLNSIPYSGKLRGRAN